MQPIYLLRVIDAANLSIVDKDLVDLFVDVHDLQF